MQVFYCTSGVTRSVFIDKKHHWLLEDNGAVAVMRVLTAMNHVRAPHF